MKYAKKMQLVEINKDTMNQNDNLQCNDIQSDLNYASPRVLSTLDRSMSDILKRNDMSDGDKWLLYNQSLHRYLNFMKQIKQNEAPKEQIAQISKDQIASTPAKQSLDSFNLYQPFNLHQSISDMSGVARIRDSLESINQPNVREFFERMRENNMPQRLSSSLDSLDDVEMVPSDHQSKKKSTKNNTGKRKSRVTPYGFRQTRSKTAPKRRTETLLSGMKPCKVVVQRADLINWDTSTLR